MTAGDTATRLRHLLPSTADYRGLAQSWRADVVAGVTVGVVARHGVEAVFVVGLLAGTVMLIGGVVGVGRFLAYVPWPVVEGFTLGIALIIFLQQVPAAIGVARPHGENTVVIATRSVLQGIDGDGTLWAVGITAIVVAVMVIAPRLHRGIPSSLVAITVAATVAHAPVSTIGRIPSSLPLPSLPGIDVGVLSDSPST